MYMIWHLYQLMQVPFIFLVIIVILNAYIDNKRRQKEPQLIRVIRDMKERMAMMKYIILYRMHPERWMWKPMY